MASTAISANRLPPRHKFRNPSTAWAQNGIHFSFTRCTSNSKKQAHWQWKWTQTWISWSTPWTSKDLTPPSRTSTEISYPKVCPWKWRTTVKSGHYFNKYNSLSTKMTPSKNKNQILKTSCKKCSRRKNQNWVSRTASRKIYSTPDFRVLGLISKAFRPNKWVN